MADLEALAARLNQAREELEGAAGAPPTKEMMAHLSGLAGEVKAKMQEAHTALHAEAKAMSADLKAKAASLRAAQMPKPPAAEEPPPRPWEDHQGLDAARLQRMIESLAELAKSPAGR